MATVEEVTGLDQPGFGGAFDLCREALDEGAALTVDEAPEPLEAIRGRYRHAYERSTVAGSAPTVGLSETVAALQATDAPVLRTAFVRHEQWPWLFVLLVEPSGRALACFGVNHPQATAEQLFPSVGQVGEQRWTTRNLK